MIRLQKYIAACGIASRRTSEKIIADGRVSVNGEIVTQLGTSVDEFRDVVAVDGVLLSPESEKHYLAYNKPVGEVTTVSDPEGRPTVMDKFADYPVRLFPVGRLDYDSEGLLLLTNDGEMMNRVLHPSHEVIKTYWTKLSNHVTPDEIAALRKGVIIGGKITSPATVRLIRENTFDTVLLISIHEGRNRQVRRMAEAVGHKVISLRRVGFGPVMLGDLPAGMWRPLTASEISRLKEI